MFTVDEKLCQILINIVTIFISTCKVASLLGQALGIAGGGDGEEEGKNGEGSHDTHGGIDDEKQLQSMMYNLMVRAITLKIKITIFEPKSNCQ